MIFLIGSKNEIIGSFCTHRTFSSCSGNLLRRSTLVKSLVRQDNEKPTNVAELDGVEILPSLLLFMLKPSVGRKYIKTTTN